SARSSSAASRNRSTPKPVRLIAESPHAIVPWMFEIVGRHIVEPTAPVYSFQARRPPTRMPRGLPLLQQLQCRDSGFVQSILLNFVVKIVLHRILPRGLATRHVSPTPHSIKK